MGLFYFAIVMSGILLFLNEEKEINKLFKAIDTYRRPFKIATFIHIIFMGVFMVPFDSIDTALILRYAVLYLFVGVILYGLYKNQPLNVLKIISLLHIVGLVGRIALEWMEWTPMKLFNVVISTAIIPLYLYIIQLVLTLKRFSSD
ncbi:hypothetical protein SAMN04488102_10748 [Alkalibacterium subtropicum]|uniref:Uncharacterized protein n=1 Tax=Alkalibacterium subtropicum TaxID=753702 RepID=A0A1I1JA92_9LACT|nr:hypothetical protein [Alkalibacterium subtropicum]SFC45519.1 hypothetical protein SAMN04488102_10748 [Alkalibacterium subtropicum]